MINDGRAEASVLEMSRTYVEEVLTGGMLEEGIPETHPSAVAISSWLYSNGPVCPE